MTAGAQISPAGTAAGQGASTGAAPAAGEASAPAAWRALRSDADIQFTPVDIPPIRPREPGWFERLLNEVLAFIGELLAPLGRLLGSSWWWLQWVLLGLVIAFLLYLAWRTFGPGAGRRAQARSLEESPEWQPDTAASLALLEDADRLAAEGRFDEATHLLLQRSVGQIAAVRPEWVEPSTTARELARLEALPEAARSAFRIITERVERSLFALRALDRTDWEAARSAYARFALAPLAERGRGA